MYGMYNMYLHLLWMAFFIGPQRDYTATVAGGEAREGKGRRGAEAAALLQGARSLSLSHSGRQTPPTCLHSQNCLYVPRVVTI